MFSVKNKTKNKLPRLPFVNVKNKILGKKYDLSLVFVSEKEIKILNKRYRGIFKPTDILSFALDKNTGEIFICLKAAKKKAVLFKRKYDNFLLFLLIHGMTHLLGYKHGRRMEKKEEKYRRIFKV